MITSLASLNCQCGLWCHSWQALICLLVPIFFFTPIHSSHTNLYSISCMLLPPFTCLHHSYFPSSSSFYYWLILPCHLLQAAFPGTQSCMKFLLRGSYSTIFSPHSAYNIVFNSFPTCLFVQKYWKLMRRNCFVSSCVSSDYPMPEK